jgi:hypothetical protein
LLRKEFIRDVPIGSIEKAISMRAILSKEKEEEEEKLAQLRQFDAVQ